MMKLTISFLSTLLLVSHIHGRHLRSEFTPTSECNSSEQRLLKSRKFQSEIVDLAYSLSHLTVNSLINLKLNGQHLDSSCATCVVDGYSCVRNKCGTECLNDGCSDQCDDCMIERCYPSIDACTGIPNLVDPCEMDIDFEITKNSNSENSFFPTNYQTDQLKALFNNFLSSIDKKHFSIDTSKLADSILPAAQKDQLKQTFDNVKSFDTSKIPDFIPAARKDQLKQLLNNLNSLDTIKISDSILPPAQKEELSELLTRVDSFDLSQISEDIFSGDQRDQLRQILYNIHSFDTLKTPDSILSPVQKKQLKELLNEVDSFDTSKIPDSILSPPQKEELKELLHKFSSMKISEPTMLPDNVTIELRDSFNDSFSTDVEHAYNADYSNVEKVNTELVRDYYL